MSRTAELEKGKAAASKEQADLVRDIAKVRAHQRQRQPLIWLRHVAFSK